MVNSFRTSEVRSVGEPTHRWICRWPRGFPLAVISVKILSYRHRGLKRQQHGIAYLMRQSQGKLYFVGDGIGVPSALNGLESGCRTNTQSCARQTKGAHCEQGNVEEAGGREIVQFVPRLACEKLPPGGSSTCDICIKNAKLRNQPMYQCATVVTEGSN